MKSYSLLMTIHLRIQNENQKKAIEQFTTDFLEILNDMEKTPITLRNTHLSQMLTLPNVQSLLTNNVAVNLLNNEGTDSPFELIRFLNNKSIPFQIEHVELTDNIEIHFSIPRDETFIKNSSLIPKFTSGYNDTDHVKIESSKDNKKGNERYTYIFSVPLSIEDLKSLNTGMLTHIFFNKKIVPTNTVYNTSLKLIQYKLQIKMYELLQEIMPDTDIKKSNFIFSFGAQKAGTTFDTIISEYNALSTNYNQQLAPTGSASSVVGGKNRKRDKYRKTLHKKYRKNRTNGRVYFPKYKTSKTHHKKLHKRTYKNK